MKDKYALVTGGSRGIGRAICLKIAEAGYSVIINYVSNESAALETLRLIEEKGGKGEICRFDVANSNEVKTTLEKWLADHPESCIEVLVNNAGIRKDNLLVWLNQEDWNSVINTSLGGFYSVTSAILSRMIRNKYGRIVNVVSLSGIKGMPGQTNYAAAKAGVIAAAKSLAQEVGRKNITVNCVAPGFIKTDMTSDINEADFKAHIPARRFGTPEEVASVVGFLSSREASYINGEVISVNGGLYT